MSWYRVRTVRVEREEVVTDVPAVCYRGGGIKLWKTFIGRGLDGVESDRFFGVPTYIAS